MGAGYKANVAVTVVGPLMVTVAVLAVPVGVAPVQLCSVYPLKPSAVRVTTVPGA
jgi:hypothetical protein